MQSRFGKSGAARKLGLVQIVVEASVIRVEDVFDHDGVSWPTLLQ